MSNKQYHFFKMINNEIVFGEVQSIQTENGSEIQIIKPFTVKRDAMIPYMSDITGNAPAAIQIHPMNVLWAVPLDEFPQLQNNYEKATSPIEVPDKKIILD